VLAAGCAVQSRTGEIKLWDLSQLAAPETLSGHRESVLALAFSPDGQTLSTASCDIIHLWDMATRQPLSSRRENFGPQRCPTLAFRPDLKQLANAFVSSEGPTLRLTGVPAGATSLQLDATSQSASLAYSADGRLLAAGGPREGVRIYDTSSGAMLQTLEADEGTSALAFSADGQLLAVATIMGRVQVWDLHLAKLRAAWRRSGNAVYGAAFSPDGRLLATGDCTGCVTLWDARHGRELAHYEEHTDAVTGLAFSADGQWLASASLDSTVGLFWHGLAGLPQCPSDCLR
jgi:WD40 repeat protein